jgi:hypothetical protein
MHVQIEDILIAEGPLISPDIPNLLSLSIASINSIVFPSIPSSPSPHIGRPFPIFILHTTTRSQTVDCQLPDWVGILCSGHGN